MQFHLSKHRRIQSCLVLLVLSVSCLFSLVEAAKDPGKIKLTKLSRLTLRNGQLTTGRRAKPVPQLQCVGGDAKGLYDIDVMVCKNLGSDYGDDDVSWSCTADVPGYFKLGSTDVFCEGYDHPDDPFVLRGSCGVEYRLQLTDAGYEKFGHSYMPSGNISRTAQVLGYFFIAIWIVFAIGACWRGRAQNGLGGGGGGYGGGGGGGGGGGWGGIDSDPPPPYPGTGRPKTQYSGASSTSTGGGGWRPGFWTGAATGAAASHLYSRSRDSNRDRGYTAGDGGFSSTAGPSRSAGWNGGGPGSSSSGGAESATRSTTGFGQTRRR